MTLLQLNEKIQCAANVAPSYAGRTLVFGGGLETASIVLVGEAPGGEEEKQGRPFVGSAGKNLSEFLDVLGLSREQIYITNLVKIRPFRLSEKTNKPVNRPPNKDEVTFFTPFLLEELRLIQPKIVCTLGNFPLKAVLECQSVKIGDLHGKLINKNEIQIFPLYHPASIIYNQSLKKIYQDDLLILKSMLTKITL